MTVCEKSSGRNRKQTVASEAGGTASGLGVGAAAGDSSESEGSMSDCSELSLPQNDPRTPSVGREKNGS